jgi:hypothetical protein
MSISDFDISGRFYAEAAVIESQLNTPDASTDLRVGTVHPVESVRSLMKAPGIPLIVLHAGENGILPHARVRRN